ncbi:MAG: hypothetical protein NC251_09710 [Lachnoclostridium sp.]|nr:hypothetical protein [Lachnospira sp.]MCM1248695.1 hypothetical protein [Lachnoclostridium sp.]MCM1534944.1 hypothetical protein [Clostridium sp.]
MVRKFTYAPELYLGESISEKKLDKIKKKLETKPLRAGVYLLTFARNPEEQLEFFDARQLALPHYEGFVFHVVGIASDWDEAAGLVERIVRECLTARGDCSLKEYLSC